MLDWRHRLDRKAKRDGASEYLASVAKVFDCKVLNFMSSSHLNIENFHRAGSLGQPAIMCDLGSWGA